MFSKYVILGLEVEHWVGWVFYVFALLFGSMLTLHQHTEIDNHIRYTSLKPVYSACLSFFITIFGFPHIFKDITIWQLIVPAIIISAISTHLIYYTIKYATQLITWFSERFLGVSIKFEDTNDNHNNNLNNNMENTTND